MVIPASRGKFGRLVKSLRPLANSEADGPRRLVLAILHLWKKSEYPLLAGRAPRGTRSFLEAVGVHNFSAWLATQSFNDAAYWLATAYAQWVGAAMRTQQALFFTPPKLADRVLDDLLARGASLTDAHWHDPACGGAAFLVPTAQRMAEALTRAGFGSKKVLEKLQKQLSGSDLDSNLLEVSEQFLQMALYPHIVATGQVPVFKLRKVDGLLAVFDAGAAPDVVVCNPPYRKLSAEEAKKYAAIFHDVIYGQPNLYGLFIRKTLDIVKPGGLIGLLTPTSFLSGAYFSKLRISLLERSDILHLDMLSDRTSMFISVEQEIVVFVLQPRQRSQNKSPLTEICVLSPKGKYQHVGRCRLFGTGAPWPIPRSVEDSVLLSGSLDWLERLENYGYTPKVGHLVPFRDKRNRFAKRPASKQNRHVVPIVWATDITAQGFSHGRSTKQVRTDYFVEISNTEHSSVHHRPSVVLQRLTSNDQKHRLVAAVIPMDWQKEQGGFVAENHVIVLLTFENNPWTPELMAGILNSAVINRLFRSISGAANVAVSELKELPLPSTSKLRKALEHNTDVNTAIIQAFGLSQ